jgi:hypothetical protein
MSFVDLAMLEIGLMDRPTARVDVAILMAMEDEPTERGPLGQQPFDRRWVRTFQLRLCALQLLIDGLRNQNIISRRLLDQASAEPLG